jgi:hypothetical protein
MRTAGFSHESGPRRDLYGGTGESGSHTTLPAPPVPAAAACGAGGVASDGESFDRVRVAGACALTVRRTSLRSVSGGRAAGATGSEAAGATAGSSTAILASMAGAAIAGAAIAFAVFATRTNY